MTTNHDEVLKVKEVAVLLSCSPTTVRKIIAQGDLPAIRVGKTIRIRAEEVDKKYLNPEDYVMPMNKSVEQA